MNNRQSKSVKSVNIGTPEQVNMIDVTIVELGPKVDVALDGLREHFDDRRSFDAFVNSLLKTAIAAKAKAEARLVLAKLGENLVKWGNAGLNQEQITLRIEQTKAKAGTLNAMAFELEE